MTITISTVSCKFEITCNMLGLYCAKCFFLFIVNIFSMDELFQLSCRNGCKLSVHPTQEVAKNIFHFLLDLKQKPQSLVILMNAL